MHSLIKGEALQPALCLSLALLCLGIYMDGNGSAPVPTVQYKRALQVTDEWLHTGSFELQPTFDLLVLTL